MPDRGTAPLAHGFDAWIQLAGAILIGAAIGWWLDRHFGLETPWCTIAFVLLGTVAGMRSIFELARRMEAEDLQSPYADPPTQENTDEEKPV
jgi:F0F1-type ATP synthase assembly protein I